MATCDSCGGEIEFRRVGGVVTPIHLTGGADKIQRNSLSGVVFVACAFLHSNTKVTSTLMPAVQFAVNKSTSISRKMGGECSLTDYVPLGLSIRVLITPLVTRPAR